MTQPSFVLVGQRCQVNRAQETRLRFCQRLPVVVSNRLQNRVFQFS